MISRIFREWVPVECAAPSDRPRCCTADWPRPGRSPLPWGWSTPIIRFIRSRGPLGGRPGRDLTADPDRSSAWAAASLRFDPDQVPNAPRVPYVSVGPGSSPVGLAPGARNGVLGGSFRSALDRAAARTAQSRGNSRAHPGCRPERSSQSARTGGQRGPSARRRRGPRRCESRRARRGGGSSPSEGSERAAGSATAELAAEAGLTLGPTARGVRLRPAPPQGRAGSTRSPGECLSWRCVLRVGSGRASTRRPWRAVPARASPTR